MSSDEATLAISRIYEYATDSKWPDLVICFHGGEPLLAGPQFYEVVFEFARSRQPRECNVEIAIQSNLTLLNESFLSLFSRYSVQVSTSLDGPQELHDRIRSRVNGKGTFKDVVAALHLLKSQGIKTGVICTMNRLNFGFEEGIFAFFKDLEQDFKANHVHNIGAAYNSDLGLTPDEIAQSMIRFFDLWFLDRTPKIKEGNTFEVSVNILTGRPSSCIFKENCQDSIVSIEFDGNVTSCDSIKYIKNQDSTIYYGNIFHQPLSEIMVSCNRREILKRRAALLDGCADCRYSDICNGGCMLDPIVMYGSFLRKTPLCPGYKRVFTHIEEALWENKIVTTRLLQRHKVSIGHLQQNRR
jgi:uncharacterized protein